MKDKAIALRFLPPEDNAPRVIFIGEGNLAKKAVELAEKNGIAVVRDPILAESLEKVPLGSEIPEPLYKAVATLFRFLLEANPSLREELL